MWALFYLIVFGGLLLLTTLSYIKYNEIRDSHHLKHRYFTEIISQVSHAMFLQDELMLELLGIQLLEDENYKDRRKSTKTFDRLLKKDPALAGFGLANIDGQFIGASSNINLSKMPNLLKDPYTRDSFQKALVTESMVLGRTYYAKGLDQWVIPLRKSVRDQNGDVIGVMTTGLKIDEHMGYLNKINLSTTSSIMLIKDFNKDQKLYRQYFSDTSSAGKKELYETPVPDAVYTLFESKIREKYNISMQELKASGKTMSIESQDAWENYRIGGVSYDKRYHLWALVTDDMTEMWYQIKKILLIYAFIFILSFFIIYRLFKHIAKSDKAKKDELLFQVLHDDLTKLPNRTYLYNNIDKWIKKLSHQFDVLLIDLDNFKNINDSFGHKVGDQILIDVADRLRSFFGENNLVVRQGGDEFIILMQCKDISNKEKIMEDVISLLSKPYTVRMMEFTIGASIGTARFIKDAQDLDVLLSLVEIAMYEAKKKKNSYCVFSPEMESKNILKVDMELELRNAVKNNELWMVYQPQITSDGKIHGVEALVRWKNEKLGFVPPDQFISVAEDTGLMPEIGAFIIQTALNEIQSLQEQLNSSFQLSINISVRQLIEVNFLHKLIEWIEESTLEKTCVTLEVTESLFIEDIDFILDLLQEVKAHGIGLSLDDFGTGYSSLSMLRKLPINELKIDKSFVDEILNIDEDRAMVESIITMGKNLSMQTLAEGVETKEQADMLRDFGCDIFQGYYFAKPLTKDDLVEFVLASK